MFYIHGIFKHPLVLRTTPVNRGLDKVLVGTLQLNLSSLAGTSPRLNRQLWPLQHPPHVLQCLRLLLATWSSNMVLRSRPATAILRWPILPAAAIRILRPLPSLVTQVLYARRLRVDVVVRPLQQILNRILHSVNVLALLIIHLILPTIIRALTGINGPVVLMVTARPVAGTVLSVAGLLSYRL